MPFFKSVPFRAAAPGQYEYFDVLLLHIPKTGGSSLEQYFLSKSTSSPPGAKLTYHNLYGEHKDYPVSFQHFTYRMIRECAERGDQFFRDVDLRSPRLKIITVLRDPVRRAVSEMNFHFKVLNKPQVKTWEKMDTSLPDLLTGASKNEFDNHRIPQCEFLLEAPSDIIVLNTESLTEQLHKLGFVDFAHNEEVGTRVGSQQGGNRATDVSLPLSLDKVTNYYRADYEFFAARAAEEKPGDKELFRISSAAARYKTRG
jgi:hypothetical protein